jgi:hypothetical protein
MMHITRKAKRDTHTHTNCLLLSFVLFPPQTVGTNVIYEMTRGAWMGIDELVGYDLI